MKVRYQIEATIVIEREESWGDDCKLDQIKNQASDRIGFLTFFVQEGGNVTPVKGVLTNKLRLKNIILIPEEDEVWGRHGK